jgi:hypothetical protein
MHLRKPRTLSPFPNLGLLHASIASFSWLHSRYHSIARPCIRSTRPRRARIFPNLVDSGVPAPYRPPHSGTEVISGPSRESCDQIHLHTFGSLPITPAPFIHGGKRRLPAICHAKPQEDSNFTPTVRTYSRAPESNTVLRSLHYGKYPNIGHSQTGQVPFPQAL